MACWKTHRVQSQEKLFGALAIAIVQDEAQLTSSQLPIGPSASDWEKWKEVVFLLLCRQSLEHCTVVYPEHTAVVQRHPCGAWDTEMLSHSGISKSPWNPQPSCLLR